VLINKIWDTLKLVYGTTVSEKKFSKIKEKIMKILYPDTEEEEIDDDDYSDRDLMDSLGIFWNYGYYHSEYKIGIELDNEDSDIRSGQDFNYNFPIFTTEELEKKAFLKKELFDSLGIAISEFELGVCVYNY
jgi:hypothetical protein